MPSAKQLAKKRGREVAQQKEAKEKRSGECVCSGVPVPGGRSCAMSNRKNRNKKDKSGGRWA